MCIRDRPTPTPIPSNYAQYLCQNGYFGNNICIFQQLNYVSSSPPSQYSSDYYYFKNNTNYPICIGGVQGVEPIVSDFPSCSGQYSCSNPNFSPSFFPIGCIPPGYYSSVGYSLVNTVSEFYLIYQGYIYAGFPTVSYRGRLLNIPSPQGLQQGYIVNQTGRTIFIQVTNYTLNNIWSIAIANGVSVPYMFDENTLITACYYETSQCQQFKANPNLVITQITSS